MNTCSYCHTEQPYEYLHEYDGQYYCRSIKRCEATTFRAALALYLADFNERTVQ